MVAILFENRKYICSTKVGNPAWKSGKLFGGGRAGGQCFRLVAVLIPPWKEVDVAPRGEADINGLLVALKLDFVLECIGFNTSL